MVWMGRLCLQVWAQAGQPHPEAPFEVATGGLEQRLKLSGSMKTKPDSIHFRKVSSISGDVGMVHVGISSNVVQYQDTMRKVCLLPKELKKEIDKMIWHEKPSFSLRAHEHHYNSSTSKTTKQQKAPREAQHNKQERNSRNHDKYYHRVLDSLTDECDMLKSEIEDMFLIW